jgi:hypothetical protein
MPFIPRLESLGFSGIAYKKSPFEMGSSEFNDFCQIEGIS